MKIKISSCFDMEKQLSEVRMEAGKQVASAVGQVKDDSDLAYGSNSKYRPKWLNAR
jgi:hypothetical protein